MIDPDAIPLEDLIEFPAEDQADDVVPLADPDAVPICTDGCGACALCLAFIDAMNAPAPDPAPVCLTYLAWTGCPGCDWPPPPSLTCRERSSARCRRDSERFRRQRLCARAHPSDGPPARGRCRELAALDRSGP